MPDLPHLRNKVGQTGQGLGGSPPRRKDFHVGGPRLQNLEDRLEIEQAVVQDDVELVQHDEVIGPRQAFAGQVEPPQGLGPVDGAFLPPVDVIRGSRPLVANPRNPFQGLDLPVEIPPLHELDERHAAPLSRHPEGQAEGGRRLPLAVSRVDLEQSLSQHRRFFCRFVQEDHLPACPYCKPLGGFQKSGEAAAAAPP